MWAAEWALIQQFAPADGGVHDGLKLVEPPASSRYEVADFPDEVITEVSKRMRDLHGYDRATRARVARERAEEQLELRREQRRQRREAERQRRMVSIMVAQRRRDQAPRASTIDDLLLSEEDHSDPAEWVGGEGWSVGEAAGATVPVAAAEVAGRAVEAPAGEEVLVVEGL